MKKWDQFPGGGVLPQVGTPGPHWGTGNPRGPGPKAEAERELGTGLTDAEEIEAPASPAKTTRRVITRKASFIVGNLIGPKIRTFRHPRSITQIPWQVQVFLLDNC